MLKKKTAMVEWLRQLVVRRATVASVVEFLVNDFITSF
jgi:hypothetical protein